MRVIASATLNGFRPQKIGNNLGVRRDESDHPDRSRSHTAPRVRVLFFSWKIFSCRFRAHMRVPHGLVVNIRGCSVSLRSAKSASRVLRTDVWGSDPMPGGQECLPRPDESRCSRSMLNGNSVQLASRKAPPLAENTEKSRGALIPRAPAIAIANNRSNTPLNRAAARVCHPNSSRKPRMVSAQVETMARVVIVPFGKNQLSCPV
jgi:hypothetical protein